ncbi:MAG: hypothetical protein GY821_13380 [Gammaproteobacteria bacterium]|nr:hypothetical protein [Gammaproteobacteria bacterium]
MRAINYLVSITAMLVLTASTALAATISCPALPAGSYVNFQPIKSDDGNSWQLIVLSEPPNFTLKSPFDWKPSTGGTSSLYLYRIVEVSSPYNAVSCIYNNGDKNNPLAFQVVVMNQMGRHYSCTDPETPGGANCDDNSFTIDSGSAHSLTN